MERLATALRTLLAHGIVRFTYQKINGDIRHAIGTRNLDLARTYADYTIPSPKGEQQPNSYYDLEAKGWRSYKPELLISIDGICPNVEQPKREIPVQKPTIKELFGGGDFNPKEMGMGKTLGTPVATEMGVELPIGQIPVEVFAKMVAHYVVEELVEKFTR